MNKTVASVIDDINEWPNPQDGGRPVYFVTAIFTDESVGSVGRKDHDAALEVQGLLREAIGQEQDFTLEAKGQTKGGRDKFKILGFGTPGGAATYTGPGVQGGSQGAPTVGPGRDSGRRPPEPSSEQAFRTPTDFRAEKALELAVQLVATIPYEIRKTEADLAEQFGADWLIEQADQFYAWMLEKTSEPALSAYRQEPVEDDSPSLTQAGASSEDSSAGGPLGPPFQPPADSEGGVATKGKEPAPPSHEHIHDYQPAQGVRGFLVCACGKTRKKETANTAPE
jgi:hypothetical protein